MLDLLSRRWWWMLVRGLAAILFGIAAFARPGMTIWVLVMLFAAYAIIDGASMIVFGRRMGNWFWYALAGLVSMTAGVIAIAWPGISAMALLWVIAAWAILNGIFQIMSGMEIRKEVGMVFQAFNLFNQDPQNPTSRFPFKNYLDDFKS